MGASNAFENPRFPVEPHTEDVEEEEGLASGAGSCGIECVRRRDLLEYSPSRLSTSEREAVVCLPDEHAVGPGCWTSSEVYSSLPSLELPFLFGKSTVGKS